MIICGIKVKEKLEKSHGNDFLIYLVPPRSALG